MAAKRKAKQDELQAVKVDRDDARESADRAVLELLRAFYLYGHYPVQSRGPAGCLHEAIQLLRPDIAAYLAEGNEAADAIDTFYPDPTDE